MRRILKEAFSSALAAVQPEECVQRALSVSGSILTVNGHDYKLETNIRIVAFGKAAVGMVRGAEKVVGEHVVEGIASVPIGTMPKYRIPSSRPPFRGHRLKTRFFEGARHNLPDSAAAHTADRVETLVAGLNSEKDILLVLVSGGGSALLPAPVEGVSLEEKLAVIRLMGARGASIRQLNIVRQRLSRLKAGRLAALAAPAQVIALIVSDIVGDPLELIAGGPTVVSVDSQTENVLSILESLSIEARELPPSVSSRLQMPSSALLQVPWVNNSIVCSNEQAVAALASFLDDQGYSSHVITRTVEGDASTIGQRFAHLIHSAITKKTTDELKPFDCSPIPLKEGDRLALIFGGETTVVVRGQGIGGRNQQLVAAALLELSQLMQNCKSMEERFALFSAGTDGQDGPTNAAGAMFTNEDLSWLNEETNKDLVDQLRDSIVDNNTYRFWQLFNSGIGHIIVGSTGTNVMDLQVLLFNL